MTLVPDLNRRALLRMGAGASATAAGVWALSAVLDPLEPRAATQPLAPAPFEPSSTYSPANFALATIVHARSTT